MIRFVLIAFSSVRAMHAFAPVGPRNGLEALFQAAVAVLSDDAPFTTRSPVDHPATFPHTAIGSIDTSNQDVDATQPAVNVASTFRATKRQRTAGEEGESLPHQVSGDTREIRTSKRLREIIESDSRPSEALPGKPTASRTDLSRRQAIVDEFVKANSHMRNSEMGPLILALMPAKDQAKLKPGYFGALISNARRKLGLQARSDPRSVVPTSCCPPSATASSQPGSIMGVSFNHSESCPSAPPCPEQTIERRRQIISEVLIEANRTGDTRAFKRVREFLKDDPVEDKALYREIDQCRKDLGLKVAHAAPRLSSELSERRRSIIEDCVKANRYVRNIDLVEGINEALQAAGIPKVAFKVLCNKLSDARKTLDITSQTYPSVLPVDGATPHGAKGRTLTKNPGTDVIAAPSQRRRRQTATHTRTETTTTTTTPLLPADGSDGEESSTIPAGHSHSTPPLNNAHEPTSMPLADQRPKIRRIPRGLPMLKRTRVATDRSADHPIVGGESVKSAVVRRRKKTTSKRVLQRREVITQFLIDRGMKRNSRTLPDLWNLLKGTGIAHATVQQNLNYCCHRLGMEMRPYPKQRASKGQCELRVKLIEDFVAANSGTMLQQDMVPLINAELRAASLPEVEPRRLSFKISAARRKLGIQYPLELARGPHPPPTLIPTTRTASAADDPSLLDDSVIAGGENVAEEEPIEEESGDSSPKRQRVGETMTDVVKHATFEQRAERKRIVEEYLLRTRIRDENTPSEIEAALAKAGLPPIARRTLREIITRSCHQLGLAVRNFGGNPEGMHRRAILEPYVSANANLTLTALTAGAYELLIPLGLHQVEQHTLSSLIGSMRKRLRTDTSFHGQVRGTPDHAAGGNPVREAVKRPLSAGASRMRHNGRRPVARSTPNIVDSDDDDDDDDAVHRLSQTLGQGQGGSEPLPSAPHQVVATDPRTIRTRC